MSTKIEWCDETINPIQDSIKGESGRGYHCTKISPGCKNCYAETINNRFGNHLPFDGRKAEFQLVESELHKLAKWKKHRNIFIQSMGDIFHKDISNRLIDIIIQAMTHPFSGANHHTYLLLTKRPERILEGHPEHFAQWPNIYLGLTVCNQQEADEKIPVFLKVPGKKFLSIEPMLGDIDISPYLYHSYECAISCGCRRGENWTPVDRCRKCGFEGERSYDIWGRDPCFCKCPECGELSDDLETVCPDCGGHMVMDHPDTPYINAIILGGETGPKARPMNPSWVRSVRDQCQAAGVPFFFKSWGEYAPFATIATYNDGESFGGNCGGPSCLSGFGGKRRSDDGFIIAKWDDGRKKRCRKINMPDHKWGRNNLCEMTYVKCGKPFSGRVLDGRTHDDLPWVE